MDKFPLWVHMRHHRMVIYWAFRMLDFIKSNADYLTLIAASFVVAWLVQRWLAKRGVFYGHSRKRFSQVVTSAGGSHFEVTQVPSMSRFVMLGDVRGSFSSLTV